MKKLTALFLSLAILLCMCPVYSFALSQNILILGDTNLDTKVNIKDATLIQKFLAHLADLTDESSVCADCNEDDQINIKDATWIQKFVANMDCPYPIGEEITAAVPDPTVPSTTVTDEAVSSTAVSEATEPSTTVSEELPSSAPFTSSSTDPTEVPTTAEVTTPVIETTTVEPTETTAKATGGNSDVEPETPPKATGGDSGVELPDDNFTTEPTESEAAVVPYEPVKPSTNITIYFSNNVSWSTVNAYLYNDNTGTELKSWPGTAMTLETINDYGEEIYKLSVDVSKYNRVVFNNGKSQTLNAAVTVASSGFYISDQTSKSAMQLGVYSYGSTDYGNKETVKLSYPTGYQKSIEIWTPAGYDPKDTSKKYSVIYLLDGQNQFDDSDAYDGGWGSDEVITALMKNGGEGIILVGIDNSTNRDNELTPDIGDVIPAYNSGGFKNGSGEEFAAFVAKTVVPYIESNYNVYTDAAHSAIVGSSSGGIEAFYIGMEYMNEFGRIGAISPAFVLYEKSTWLEYFKKFDFTDSSKLPRIYFYNGGGDSLEQELLPDAEGMMSWLADLGYDESKMTFVYDEKNGHNEAAWRAYMPEIVTWLFELQ